MASCLLRYISLAPVHGLPHMDYQMDYPTGLSNGLLRWITHMDFLINYPRKRKERNITPRYSFCLNSPIRHLVVFILCLLPLLIWLQAQSFVMMAGTRNGE